MGCHYRVARHGLRLVGKDGVWDGKVDGTTLWINGEAGKRYPSEREAMQGWWNAFHEVWCRGDLELNDGASKDGKKLGAQLMADLWECLAGRGPAEKKLVALVENGAAPDYREEYTLAYTAARAAQLDVLRALVRRGARLDQPNINASPSGFETPLLASLGDSEPATFELLIELGADPSVVYHDLLDEQEMGLGSARDPREALDRIEDEELARKLHRLVAAGAKDTTGHLARIKAEFDPAVLRATIERIERLGTPAGLKTPGWGHEVAALLSPMPDGARGIEDACAILAKAVGHPEWAELVRKVIACSPLFEDVAVQMYGKRVSFDDDEGPLVQSWDDGYSSLSMLVERVLSKKPAMAHREWGTLMTEVLDRGEATRNVPADQIGSVLRKKEAKAHPATAKLKARLKALE